MRLNHAAAEGEAGLPPAALLGGASRLHAVDQVRPFPRPLARFRLSPESHLARHRPTLGRSPHVSALVSVSGSRCRLPRASRARRAGTTPACLFGARLASIYSPLQDRHWQSQSPQSLFCEGRISGARHCRGSVWCRGRPALRRTVRGVGAGSSSSYSSRWRPRTCRGTWMATVTTPAALRFLLCLGLITETMSAQSHYGKENSAATLTTFPGRPSAKTSD